MSFNVSPNIFFVHFLILILDSLVDAELERIALLQELTAAIEAVLVLQHMLPIGLKFHPNSPLVSV